jgi:hypothetical protein
LLLVFVLHLFRLLTLLYLLHLFRGFAAASAVVFIRLVNFGMHDLGIVMQLPPS